MASSSDHVLLHHLYSSPQISDENLAEELQLQEAIALSISTSTTMAGNKRSTSKTSFCTICTDIKTASEMFTTRACSHSFCADCISKHIASKLEANVAVKCPEPKCAVALEPEMCGSFVPKEVLERWGDALLEAMIAKTKRVYCPFEDCSAEMIDEEEGAEMIDEGEGAVLTAVECPECWRLFCSQCKVGWHGDMECGEFQKLGKGRTEGDEVLMMKLAESKKWKRCPNCNIYVEKISGCQHITCSCGSEFCYHCGSQWSSSHAC